MITHITKLKKFGIFEDFRPSKNLLPFAKFNLFYGWNGSGKSTLAKIFLSLGDRRIHEHFPDSEFSIQIADCPDITHKNIDLSNSNIRVFSKEFIERNVNFEHSKANSILILSEEKIEEMAKYKKLVAERSQLQLKYNLEIAAHKKEKEQLQKSLSKWASNIKRDFELIETSNRHYLNYDRTKLTQFIRENRNNISKDHVLPKDEVRKLKTSINPEKKPDILLATFTPLVKAEVLGTFETASSLLAKSIISKQIEKLIKDPTLNSWIEMGLEIHTNVEHDTCEFCGSTLSQARINELEEHFSLEYQQTLLSLEVVLGQVASQIELLNYTFIDTANFYGEFAEEYKLYKDECFLKRQALKNEILALEAELKKKKSNPFEKLSCPSNDISGLIDEYDESVSKVHLVVIKHNKKNENFDEQVKKAQDSLELHFVSAKLIEENYEVLEASLKGNAESLKNDFTRLETYNTEILGLESVLLNETIGAQEFNRDLEKFLGRQDLLLEFDKELKGYKLLRRGMVNSAKNLSEGEKTAIAFVYFISKLKENGNRIDDTIIVVDDPISSFDSNHLFHSYSYLKQNCEKAAQLFILTHNFNYYKLVRDWLIKKNERKKQTDGSFKEIKKSSFYSIDCTIGMIRKATINNANPTLLRFNSEYHYIFYKLLCFKGNDNLDLEHAFLVANLSRRLLEGFLTFKFPKGRSDFSQLLEAGCSDQVIREKVYRFINKYSHNQQIEFYDSAVDNLLGESSNIVDDILNIVNQLDPKHYQEMHEICTN